MTRLDILISDGFVAVTSNIPIGTLAFLLVAGIFLTLYRTSITPFIRFAWHCFFRPLGAKDQRERLDKFYEGQAEVYDRTRNGLLRGRETMLSLSASHLRELHAGSKERFVWVDIGGGTGHNIEAMSRLMPISSFDRIYLIDLCEPLLAIARKRFAACGWTNITVLCQDASEFALPEWTELGINPKGSVGFVTLSYSLSMIPSFYTLLDRIDHVLSPDEGLLSVVDFYTAGKQLSLHEKAIGGTGKECGWLSRWFWQIWFDFDHVSLSPARRQYLEYRFGTIKSYNGRNRCILPFVVRIPYYIWLGRPRSCDVSRMCHAFEVEGGNMIGNCSPLSLKAREETCLSKDVPELDLGSPAIKRPSGGAVVIDVTYPLSSFHYAIRKPWRLPYYDHPVHKEFRTFIYSFTWEDPMEDMRHLQLSSEDSMLVITSAGDNALHYAVHAKPRRIHCVDMNPCQGHLLELKLAALQALPYADFFRLFGDGHHPDFPTLLTSKIAPFLSSAAFQFWQLNADMFTSKDVSFYMRGYSGVALRAARVLFRLVGVADEVRLLCEAETLGEQKRIWWGDEKHRGVRRALFNRIVVALLRTPMFCWNALGVPMNQRQMLLEDGSMYEYLRDTLDPIASTQHLKKGAYFYLLTLLGRYTPESCPAYLTAAGVEALKRNDGEALDAFRLHTDSIVNVLRGLPGASLTRVILMDHLDWFAPGAPEVEEEVREVARAVAPGGLVFWRSAARVPWYQVVFEKAGFDVVALAIRTGSEKPIDGVNMYASFWRATKPLCI